MPPSMLTRTIPTPSSGPCAASSLILHWQWTYARAHYSVPLNSAGARPRPKHSPLTRKHWQGVKNNMRVLMISKALVAGTSQRKLEELAKCPGVELTLVTPPHWQSDDGSKQVLERLYTGGYQMIVTPIRLNGNFHLHFYPRLGKIMRDVHPEVVHIDEEAYNFATFHAMWLANRQKARALFFTWQNLYRNYPPPFRQMEVYNYHHAAVALAG